MNAPFSKNSTRKLIQLAAQPGGITIADVMRTRVCTMGEAIGRLRQAEDAGRILRSGGEPGTAFRWSAAGSFPASGDGVAA